MSTILNTTMLDVFAGNTPAHSPVWIMRQAGRYLADYRKVRSQFKSFMEFCRTPDKVMEVTIQPVDQVGVDAAILFSDILVLLPPLGLELDFLEKKGPVIANPIEDAARIKALPDFDIHTELKYVFEGIKLTKQALQNRVPLIGFAGGPFTVASYMVEGGSSKELAKLKALMYSDPLAFTSLLDKIAKITAAYLSAQVEAGADIITIMDSWAGYLSPEDYRQYVFLHTQFVIATLRRKYPQLPIVHYANGASTLLPHFVELGASAIGLDWRIDLESTLKKYPQQIFQGNLDPCFLFSESQKIAAKVGEIKKIVGHRPHVFNLGHGILPNTPVDHARAFVDAVHAP